MKRILFYILGNMFISFGVALLIKAGLGTGSWDALFVGLSKTIGLSVGTWVFIGGSVVMVVNKFLVKEKLDIPAFLTIFLTGLFIDLFLKFVVVHFRLDTLPLQIIVFAIGVSLLALGIAVYIQANFATNPMDNLMISLNKRFGFSFRLGRTIGEICALLLALLLNGPVFFGTLVVAFTVGPLIQLFHKPVERLYQNI